MAQKRLTAKGKVYWIARWRDAGGKEHSKSFKLEREAKKWESEQRKGIVAGEWRPDAVELTVAEYVQIWVNAAESQGTKKQRGDLADNLGHLAGLPMKSVRPVDLDKWVAYLLEGRPWLGGKKLSPSSARLKREQLAARFSRAQRDSIIAHNPFTSEVRKITAVTTGDELYDADREEAVSQVLSLSEIDKMIWHAEHGAKWTEKVEVRRRKVELDRYLWKSLESAVLMEISAGTGLRGGEAGGLNIEDWDRSGELFRVRFQARVKSQGRRKLKTANSKRDVPVPNHLAEVLDRYLFESRHLGLDKDRPLVVTRRGNRWVAGAINKKVVALRPVIGNDWVTFHDLRHFYATTLLSRGMPANAVAELMGHTVDTLNRVYSHFLPEDSTRAKSIMDELSGMRGYCGDQRVSHLRVVGE